MKSRKNKVIFLIHFKVAENLQEKKNRYRSRDYKGSMFTNYSGSLIEATDERRSKEKSKTLHQKRLPIVIKDGLMTEIVPSDGPMLEDSNVKSTVVAMEAATTGLGLADGGDKDFDGVCQPIRKPDVVKGMVEDDIVIAGNLSDEVVDGDRCENNSNEVAGSMGNEAVSDALVSAAVTSVLERAPSTVMHADQVLEEDQMQTVTSAGNGKSGTSFLPSANMSSPLRKIADESSFLSINDNLCIEKDKDFDFSLADNVIADFKIVPPSPCALIAHASLSSLDGLVPPVPYVDSVSTSPTSLLGPGPSLPSSLKLPLLTNSQANIISGSQKHINANFRHIPNLSNDINVPVDIPMAAVSKICETHAKTICGYFVGKNMLHSDVRYLASKMWSQHGLVDILLNGHDVYLFKFSDDQGLQHVITHGPWTFKGFPIVIQKWRPGLSIHKNKHDKLPLWIKIHDIPYEAWSHEGLSHIASKIGMLLLWILIRLTCVLMRRAKPFMLVSFLRSPPGLHGWITSWFVSLTPILLSSPLIPIVSSTSGNPLCALIVWFMVMKLTLIALDRDPFNRDLRDEQCRYLLAYNEACLDEERFLKQKAKISLDHDNGMLCPAHQRSLVTLSTAMLMFAAKMYQIPDVADLLNPMLKSDVNNYLGISDDFQVYIKPQADINEYSSDHDNQVATAILLNLQNKMLKSYETIVNILIHKLSTITEDFPTNSLVEEDDASSESSVSDLSRFISKSPIQNSMSHVISIRQLLESALEAAGQVAGASVSTSPLPFNTMAGQCEALGTDSRKKLSTWLSHASTDATKPPPMAALPTHTSNAMKILGEEESLCTGTNGLRLPPASPFDNFLKAARYA
ncbi:hypothetical protein L1887_00004 [Cichorium endivia]|nr:hypothetical protein L1887_00004 [Cichorium endivia]